jgi:hypothetical protein
MVITSVVEHGSINLGEVLTVHLLWNVALDINGHMYGLWMPAILANNTANTTDECNSINTSSSAAANPPALQTTAPTPPISVSLPMPQQQPPRNVHTNTLPTHTPQQYHQQQQQYNQQQHGRYIYIIVLP